MQKRLQVSLMEHKVVALIYYHSQEDLALIQAFFLRRKYHQAFVLVVLMKVVQNTVCM